MKKLIIILLAGSAGFALQNVATAETQLMKFAERGYHAITGYSADACSADAAGCLEAKRAPLARSKDEILKAIRNLEAEALKTATLSAENEQLLAKNTFFLEQGKAALNAGLANGTKVFSFAGRTYPDAATFRAQLELLFNEKTSIETQVKASHELHAKMEERLQQLRLQQGRVEAALDNLPSQISLAQANVTLSTLDDQIKMIDNAVSESNHQAASSESLIGGTRELEKRAENSLGLTVAQQQANERFDAYLKQ